MVIDIPTKAGKVPDLKQRDVRESSVKGRVKTSYVSIPHTAFTTKSPDVDDRDIGSTEGITASADSIAFRAPVYLPQGAIITAAVVHGNAGATAEVYQLERITLITGDQTAITGGENIGTENSTIVTGSIVDNSLYTYYFITSTLDTNDKIYLDGIAGNDNESAIVTPTVGEYCAFYTFLSGSGTYDWIAASGVGTWTAGA